MMRAFVILFVIFGVLPSLHAQMRHVQGELLLCLDSDRNPQFLQESNGPSDQWEILRQVTAQPLNIWLIRNNDNSAPLEALISWFNQQAGVLYAQPNHIATLRDTNTYELQVQPNDPFFGQQWHLNNTGQSGGLPGADLGMLEAWSQTTGGITPAGDTIVIAVIDGGLCTSCSDISENLWVNRHEIPDDGLDNDNNGYFDDYLGWNVNNQNDHISSGYTSHGTAVSGIIAAKGNNYEKITGINWNTKIQFVAGTSGNQTTEAQILGAFEYVYKSRKAYNTTDGAMGAFVVAVNCSFGINFGTPSQFPLWCEIIELLGQEGVLTVAAVANGAWNIDEVGDMPSACTSSHLITVTSLDHNDQKVPEAAWGKTHVDLGAYGKNILTLSSSSQGTAIRSGTSYAAPQVSAAIGLLYAAPCHNLIALSKESPGAGALLAKDVLLESAKPVNTLASLVATDGRLQVGDMLNHYKDICQTCPPPYWLTTGIPDTNQVALSWVETITFSEVTLRWRAVGDTIWNLIQDVSSSYTLSGLQPCTAYEYALRASCDAGGESSWSVAEQFTTDGCCEPPSTICTTEITPISVKLTWNKVTAAECYHLRYRDVDSFSWEYLPETTENFIEIQNLATCTNYIAELKIKCKSGWSAYSSAFYFKSKGCGACYDQNYCLPHTNSASEEWIKKVQIGNWENNSSGHQGYETFFNAQANELLVLQSGATLMATIEPDFLGLSYKQFFRIYIDFNQDGDFDDQGEAAFAPDFATDDAVTDTLKVPFFIGNGISRMRVMMKFKSGNFTTPPTSCEEYEYGQVEDYCVHLSKLPTSSVQSTGEQHQQILIMPNPCNQWIGIQVPSDIGIGTTKFQIRDTRGILQTEWQMDAANGYIQSYAPEKLIPGMYFLQMHTPGGITYQAKFIRL